ncbi:unnamed protein product [Brachionus calyciflorus]|uniref:G-protein coupled receptors family 1 profile domain-containing protein n=1 Tax=Brachionus calyciflorus TaxID=104777 RepID=A0A813MB47_9BILA|nr:unnamed protein product [Brachionus calyciflorus]
MNSSNFTIIEDFDYIFWASSTAKNLLFYSCVLLFVPGTFLNTLQTLIFLMKIFSKTSMGYYYSINSALNLVIVIYLLIFCMPMSKSNSLFLYNSWGCRLFYYFLRVLYQSSSWLNVAIVADRVVFILFPNKFNFLKKKKFLTLILIAILSIILITNITNFGLNLVIIRNNWTNQTTKYCSTPGPLVYLRDIHSILFRSAIPFTLMLVMNIILIAKVNESKKKLKMKYEIKFVFTVIATTFTFLFTYIPNVVWTIFQNRFQNDPSVSRRQTYEAFIFLFEMSSSASYFVNYSMNIFVHMAFNSLFRKEVIRLVFNLFRIRNNQIENSTILSFRMNTKNVKTQINA